MKTLCINDLEYSVLIEKIQLKFCFLIQEIFCECLIIWSILCVRNNLILCNVSWTNNSFLWQHLRIEQKLIFSPKWKETQFYPCLLLLIFLIWYLSSECRASQFSSASGYFVFMLYSWLEQCPLQYRSGHFSVWL